MKIVKHSIYNLLGLGLPLIAAVFTIPVLVEKLGDARFGLLTLIWAVVSYFGLLDFGLGRALTQQLAIVFSKDKNHSIGPLVGTATIVMAVLGLFAGFLMAASAAWGVGLIKSVPDQIEASNAVYAMAIAMPFIVLTSAFRGILEASHSFGVINLIRVPMGLLTFIGPLAVVVYWQPRLDLIAIVLSAGRVLACAVHGYYAWRALPEQHGPISWETKLLRPLSISGGWMSVSNIISPFMGYVDRFTIGAIISASAVAYYVTPQELITKLWIVPGALTTVLFPAFAAQMSQRDPTTFTLFNNAVYWLFVMLLPVTATIGLFARELLSIWINPEFATNSAPLLQIFAFGIFVNCLAHVPYTLIQGAGEARLTAALHALQLPFFLLALWWFTTNYGLIGAAFAWLLRILVDAFLMFAASMPLLNRKLQSTMNYKTSIMIILASMCFAGVLIESWIVRILWILPSICFAGLSLYLHLQPKLKITHNKL